MTDWRAAGQLADAHRVTALARGEYGSPVKVMARTTAVAFIRSYCTGTVLDLWGGGTSAEELVRAGFDVVSVEDGRWLKGLGVSKVRAARALRQSGLEGGYETAWGHASSFASGCSGAFLDFCGHWSSEVRRTLEHSAHMDAIVLTLMPERVAVGRGLSTSEWRTIYVALIKSCLPKHQVRLFRRYRREAGQWAFIFGLAKVSARPFGPNVSSKTPEAKRLSMNLRYAGDPEFREKQKRASLERERNLSEEAKSARRERATELQRQRRAADPEKHRADRRRYEAACPRKRIYGDKERVYHAAYYQRRKAAGLVAGDMERRKRVKSGVSGTPDEAI